MIGNGDRQRLVVHAERVRTLEAELGAERARRNRIIRWHIDNGETYRAVARAARLSVAQVAGILARPEVVEV